MEFKNKNVNRKSKNPSFVWSNIKKEFRNFDEMLQFFFVDSKERQKGLKTSFISANQQDKLALKKSKKRISIDKKKRGF